MRKWVIALLVSVGFITSCTEVVIVGTAIVGGGVIGYYAGKEGYKVKVEKEKK